MTLEELRRKIREWDSQGSKNGVASAYYQTILNELDFHALRDWKVYLPAEHPDNNSNYMERLASWVGNTSGDNDQKLMLEYALRISFFCHHDFIAMYRTAFNREVTRWVTEKIGADFSEGVDSFQKKILKTIHRNTWFCPVTDSMDINEFYKTNHVQGIGHRPGFLALQMLAKQSPTCDDEIIKQLIHYMNNPSPDPRNPSDPIEYIVLLEDIVGSGSQCAETIKWASSKLKKPILFIPLIICPEGVKTLSDVEDASAGLLTVRPIIKLCKGDLLGPNRCNIEMWNRASDMEGLVDRYSETCPFCYEPYGYRSTGSSIVTFTNTPDNTVSLVHDRAQSGIWSPLFPRVYRDT